MMLRTIRACLFVMFVMFVNLGGESEGDCVLRVPSPRDKCSMLLALEISAMVSRRTLTLPVPDSLLS
jgi:hypothetical protein